MLLSVAAGVAALLPAAPLPLRTSPLQARPTLSPRMMAEDNAAKAAWLAKTSSSASSPAIDIPNIVAPAQDATRDSEDTVSEAGKTSSGAFSPANAEPTSEEEDGEELGMVADWEQARELNLALKATLLQSEPTAEEQGKTRDSEETVAFAQELISYLKYQSQALQLNKAGGGVAVRESGGMMTKPQRRSIVKPPMVELMESAGDLLSHQAIMENFVSAPPSAHATTHSDRTPSVLCMRCHPLCLRRWNARRWRTPLRTFRLACLVSRVSNGCPSRAHRCTTTRGRRCKTWTSRTRSSTSRKSHSTCRRASASPSSSPPTRASAPTRPSPRSAASSSTAAWPSGRRRIGSVASSTFSRRSRTSAPPSGATTRVRRIPGSPSSPHLARLLDPAAAA